MVWSSSSLERAVTDRLYQVRSLDAVLMWRNEPGQVGLYVPAPVGGRDGAVAETGGRSKPWFSRIPGALAHSRLWLTFLRAGPVGRPLDLSSCLFAVVRPVLRPPRRAQR
jgi:hypothetical protein